uniref:Env polyprotein n=1 Tax=Retroviridae sp. TaxID=2681591 RepID=A0A7D5Q0S0_9RETR|nr:MAG: envelope polyprotein [Retroviridae sp.]
MDPKRDMLGLTLHLVLLIHLAPGLTQIEPRDNIWVTWANSTGQSAFCLSLAKATDPFRTCLFGVPIGDKNELKRLLTPYSVSTSFFDLPTTRLSEAVMTALITLNTSLPWDPQELDLLGSVAVGNTSNNWTQTCFMWNKGKQNTTQWTNVTSHTRGFEANGGYCGYNGNATMGAWDGSNVTWPPHTAKALPPGIFLICGDRAWQGIPANSHGGPCYLGRLTLFAPDLHSQELRNITRQWKRRTRRSLKTLGSDCNDQVELWGPAERFFSAALVPGVAVAHAMASLGKLACWAVKQANVTTQILTEMAQDLDSMRHAVLQNRAAIDFLLLAQGHGCEELEGMCCFNLSDHGESIQEQLKWLRDHTKKIVVQDNWLDRLFANWFGNMGGWILGLIKEGLRLLLIIILIIIAARIVFSCLTKKLEQLTSKVFLAQNKNGGIVEDWLAARNHIDLVQLQDKEMADYRTQLV